VSKSAAYVEGVASSLRSAGIDIVYPFTLSAALDRLFSFPRFGHTERLGLLVGNSRALWAPLVRFAATYSGPHPVQTYVAEHLTRALEARGVEHTVFLPHRLDYDGPNGKTAIPIQQLGARVGLAALGPSHLSVHPQFGPWFAYRAIVEVNLPPLPKLDVESKAPCLGCSAPCVPALHEALEAPREGGAPRYEPWLAVRDACPEHPDERYSEPQIRYHYTKERRWLVSALENAESRG
jgi:hypothetical protein